MTICLLLCKCPGDTQATHESSVAKMEFDGYAILRKCGVGFSHTDWKVPCFFRELFGIELN